jgi:hypothetical protein
VFEEPHGDELSVSLYGLATAEQRQFWGLEFLHTFGSSQKYGFGSLSKEHEKN